MRNRRKSVEIKKPPEGGEGELLIPWRIWFAACVLLFRPIQPHCVEEEQEAQRIHDRSCISLSV